MVLSVRSSASLLAIALLVPATLAALPVPASARLSESLTMNLAVQFVDGVHTEMLELDLAGGFAVQVTTQPGPISAPVRGAASTVIHYHGFVTNSAGVPQEFSGTFQVDSFFDVFLDVGIQGEPGVEAIHYAIITDLSVRTKANDVPLADTGLLLQLSKVSMESTRVSYDPRTRGSMTDSFFDVFSEVTVQPGPAQAPLASYLAESRLASHLGQPGPVSAPTVQLDSFFDVFAAATDASRGTDSGADVASPDPGVETHQRGIDAHSFFDVTADVSTPGAGGTTLHLGGTWRTDAMGQPGAQQGQGVFFAGEHTDSFARFLTPLVDLNLDVAHGAELGGEFIDGTTLIPGRSFFDVFYEIEIPQDRVGEPDPLIARFEQDLTFALTARFDLSTSLQTFVLTFEESVTQIP